ncbi:MAG: hypothetical protein RIC07_13485 [Coleofasciculus sp. E1-EBD-02]
MTGHIHSFLIIPVSSIKKSRTRWLKSKTHLRVCRGDPNDELTSSLAGDEGFLNLTI